MNIHKRTHEYYSSPVAPNGKQNLAMPFGMPLAIAQFSVWGRVAAELADAKARV